MLQKQAVEPKLLELLEFLMKEDTFKDFVLVGGTSLALQLGHRISVDIDLFGNAEVNELDFNNVLSENHSTKLLKKSKSILIYSINGIKVDFVNYRYPLIDKVINYEGIRMASDKDIAAMKLSAIAGRGSKKDFIDLYFLLEKYTIEEIMDFYKQKFTDGSEFMVQKSLSYFEDADKEEMPKMLIDIRWEDVKDGILDRIR